jgi:hypothetical protein
MDAALDEITHAVRAGPEPALERGRVGRTDRAAAATLGYTDIAYFSRQYKRHTGHSPRRAR